LKGKGVEDLEELVLEAGKLLIWWKGLIF